MIKPLQQFVDFRCDLCGSRRAPAGTIYNDSEIPRSFMRKRSRAVLCVVGTLLLSSCSPRDFLTRRLAGDLIAGSPTFRASQTFHLRTGVLSNQDYLSPDYLVLQHRGWISAVQVRCLPDTAPPPCWDVTLTPSGVDTFQSLIAPGAAEKQSFTIPTVRRGVVSVSGIAKDGEHADVEFTWRWIPLNEVGAALYSGDIRYRTTAGFRAYDDGWRLVQRAPQPIPSLEEALKNAEPLQ